MKTLGLDVSTHTGMALIDEQGGKGKVVNFPDHKGWSRLHSIAMEVRRTLEVWKPDLAIIEAYAYSNANTLVLLVECGTVLRSVLHGLNIPWWTIPPTSLKKWTTGKGSADKLLMAAKVYERWGFRSPSDDIVDAYALAQVGQLGVDKMTDIKGVLRGN